MKNGILLIVLFAFLMAACTPQTAAPAAETPAAGAPFTLSTATPTPPPVETAPAAAHDIGAEPTVEESLPTPAPTQPPFEPFTATVWADHVNVRSRPGYLFPSLLQLNEGDQFTVVARAPGDEWLHIELDDGTTGWVFVMLVQMDYDIRLIPLEKPDEVQIITGQLLTPAGQPINGVQFMITQTTASGERRTDASTDQYGVFTAFLPPDAAGEWTVAYTAVACTSVVHNSACNIRPEYAGTANPPAQTVTLPDADTLQFIWK